MPSFGKGKALNRDLQAELGQARGGRKGMDEVPKSKALKSSISDFIGDMDKEKKDELLASGHFSGYPFGVSGA